MVLYKLDKQIVSDLRKEAEECIDPILQKHNLRWEHVFAHNKSALYIAARQEIYVAIRNRLKWSYPKIGRLFNRDHASVLHSVRRYKNLKK